jgi:[ribosomal protein S5]-alanine N-acetyltransferase
VGKAPRQFDTQRLTLIAPHPDDAEAIFERYASDPEVTTYLGWPRHRSIVETRSFLEFSALEWERWPAGPYLIRSRDDGRLLGGTGLSFKDEHTAITGYVLAKDSWGKGYASESLAAMVDLAHQLGVTRVEALCHPQHRVSWRILERAGFARESGYLQSEFPNLAPGVKQDTVRYALLLGAAKV